MSILNDPRVMATKIEECGEPLVILDKADFLLEPMYFNWGYNESTKIELREGVLLRLQKAKEVLNSRGGCENWDLKIWDGFRTLNTQKILYDTYYDELKNEHADWDEEQLNEAVQIFVSRPSRDPLLPAPHNTGGAIDLTIVDENGNELPMGSKFDEFNEKSYTNHFENDDSEEGVKFHSNRVLLSEIMASAMFVNYHEEWWHFSYGDQAWAAENPGKNAIYGSLEI